MKIALIVPGGVDRSGVDRVIPCILWLIERLAAGGDEVHVFALNQEPRPARWPLLGATVHNAGWRPRLLVTLGLILAEHRRGGFDAIHGFWASSGGFIGALAARLLRRPLVLTLPGGDVARVPAIGYGTLTTPGGRARLAFAARAASAVTAPSRAMCALAAGAGIAAEHLPLGVALDRWPPASPRRRDMRAPIRLLHVASLNRVKDQAMLLRAMAILRAWEVPFSLDIVGEDVLDGEVQRHAAELGLSDYVRFHGHLPHAALRPWFERSDLLVMSSLHEAGPIVTLEAAAAGIPTVGTAVGHIADLAPEAAIAVPCGDAPTLAEAIREIAGDEQKRLRLAEAAGAAARANDADLTATRFRALYAAIGHRRGKPSPADLSSAT